MDVTFFSEKNIKKTSPLKSLETTVFHDSSKPTTTLCNNKKKDTPTTYDQINFLKVCKEKFHRNQLPTDFDQWTIEQQVDHVTGNVDRYFPNIPVSLRYILPANFKDGDCGRPEGEKPEWLDMDKFRRGQAFTQRYITSIYLAHVISLFIPFVVTDGLKTLILTQKSNTPYRAFQRYSSTVFRVQHWYQKDPWDERTQAYQDIKAVRNMHLKIRRKVCSYNDEQIDRMSQIPNVYCPMMKTLVEDFRDSCPAMRDFQSPFNISRGRSLNQGDMSCTQFIFVGLIVFYPEKFGIHRVSDEDMEAFCHMWRGLGYLLGIEDRYNFCRGSMQDVRKRCIDMLEYFVKPGLSTVIFEWEHMSMCIHEGLRNAITLPPFKFSVLYFCEILNLEMPRLRKSFNLLENAHYMLMKFVLHYLMMMPFIVVILNTYTLICLKFMKNFGPKEHAELKKKSRAMVGF